jgi:hypothetical protein
MSLFSDDGGEMPRSVPFDDGEIDALLSSATAEGVDPLLSFVGDVRAAAEAVPTPSPALAAALAAGFSTDKGDLPATAASTVHGPASQVAGLPKWRTAKMKIKGFLAGLGVAGKVALGGGVAFACTTGAGAAGVLPGPMQHVVASAVDSVTPFSMPDGEHHDKVTAPPGTTTTTKPEVTTTTKPKPVEKPIVTPTTKLEPTTTTTKPKPVEKPVETPKEYPPPTEPKEAPPTTKPEAPPTTKPPQPEPAPMVLECVASNEGVAKVHCAWSADSSDKHKKYLLYRIDGQVLLQSENALSFDDTTVVPGESYSYKVKSYDVYGNLIARSEIIGVDCC